MSVPLAVSSEYRLILKESLKWIAILIFWIVNSLFTCYLYMYKVLSLYVNVLTLFNTVQGKLVLFV